MSKGNLWTLAIVGIFAVVWLLDVSSEPRRGRYAIAASGDQGGLVYRLDTATGDLLLCGGYQCSPVTTPHQPGVPLRFNGIPLGNSN